MERVSTTSRLIFVEMQSGEKGWISMIPDCERSAEPIPEVHDMSSGESLRATFFAVEPEKVTKAIGMDDTMKQVRGVFKLGVNPLLQIVRCNHKVAPLAPGLRELEGVATSGTQLLKPVGRSPVRPYDEMEIFLLKRV